MERCGDCKFWGKPGDTEVFRPCGGVIHDERSRHNEEEDEFWDSEMGLQIGNINEQIRDINSRPAVVIDGSGCFAALKTKEDFGCVLFERRGDEQSQRST